MKLLWTISVYWKNDWKAVLLLEMQKWGQFVSCCQLFRLLEYCLWTSIFIFVYSTFRYIFLWILEKCLNLRWYLDMRHEINVDQLFSHLAWKDDRRRFRAFIWRYLTTFNYEYFKNISWKHWYIWKYLWFSKKKRISPKCVFLKAFYIKVQKFGLYWQGRKSKYIYRYH